MTATMNGNSENGRSLPDGWELVTIGDVADTTSGGTPSRKYSEYFEGTIPWVKSGELGDGLVSVTEEKITETAIKNSSAKIFPAGSVLVALYGATIGKVGILNMDAASNQAVCALFPKNNSFIAKYMFYWLMSQKHDLINKSVGGAQPNISQGIVRAHPFPLSPISEQERIVTRIEELLSDLDAGVVSLERTQIGLKRYKVSVLKAAVEGRLFGDVEMGDDGLLPGWVRVTIDDVAESLDNKRVPVNKKEREKRHGQYPYFGANGQVDWIDDYIFDEPLVLVVEDETFTGREKPFSYKITGKTWVNNHAHVLRAKENILDVDYLNYSLAYYPFTPMTTGTTGRKKLTKSVLMAAPYLLPPLDEQRRIVAEVERRLSVVVEVESAVEVGLVRAGRLRQSVLRSAFEGRL